MNVFMVILSRQTTVSLFYLLFISWSMVQISVQFDDVKFDKESDQHWLRSFPELPARSAVCGHGLCHCHWNTANCSRHPSGLHYIPPLPGSIRYLHFSFNGLETIPADFFQNITQLFGVDLSNNKLTHISPDAFRLLPNLILLYLSKNTELNYTSLTPAFNIPTLHRLDIMSCELGPPPRELFKNATLPNLRSLSLESNSMGNIALSVFKPLTSLKYLDLGLNDIVFLYVDCVSGLNKLGLGTNALFDLPRTCDGEMSLFPELECLFLEDNHISEIPEKVCLPKLEMLSVGKNKIPKITSYSFSGQKFPRLTYLSMFTMNTAVSEIESNAFNNSVLRRINLSFDGIKFGDYAINNDSFANCPQIQTLQLSHNSLDIDDHRFVQLFGHLKQLQRLDLQASRLTRLSSLMVSGFPNLTTLTLNRNLLSSLPDGVFDHLYELKHLDLGKNQLRVVLPTTFNILTRRRLQNLDLSGNPFTCSCDILWFKNWLTSSPSLFENSYSTYDCHNIPNMPVQHFFLHEQACLMSHSTSLLVVGSVSLVIVSLTMISIVFRYRWHCRLLLHEAFRGRGGIRRRRLQEAHFDYDVFVSYDSEDLPWVQNHLLPEMEGRLGLRLCLHQRDFTIGWSIVDNIADSVDRSKKVMMLFSNNFVQSQWCQFELMYCLRYAMDYDDSLIIVCLDDMSVYNPTGAMMAVLKTTTYIQWEDDRDAIASFWGRLQIALQEIIVIRQE